MTTSSGKTDTVEATRAPFIEHLRELRTRVIVCMVAVGVGIGVTWTWVEEIFFFLLRPLRTAAASPDLAQMHHRNLTEPFYVLMKTALFAGIILAIPVILWQIWGFIGPGLYPKERRMAIPMVTLATLFFIGGAAFAYYFVLPFGYEFLLKFGEDVSTPELMMQEYLTLTTKLLLAFGAIFQMPIISTVLARIGLINGKMMLAFWKYALVICFVVGALLTPPDIISQVLLAGPMMGLYAISVVCAFIFGKRAAAPDEALVEASVDTPEAD